MRETESLSHAAERAAAEPDFVGYALARLARREGVGWRDIARRLGVGDSAACNRLALCLLPLPGTAGFKDRVQRIASYAGLDAAALRRALEEGLDGVGEDHGGAS